MYKQNCTKNKFFSLFPLTSKQFTGQLKKCNRPEINCTTNSKVNISEGRLPFTEYLWEFKGLRFNFLLCPSSDFPLSLLQLYLAK